jgi:hypothetical protein
MRTRPRPANAAARPSRRLRAHLPFRPCQFAERTIEGGRRRLANPKAPVSRVDPPPLGPALSLPAWAKTVTSRAREFLPEIRAVQKGRTIVWTRGSHRATLEAGRDDWWMKISSSSGTGTGVSTHSDRHDHYTAMVAASNIVVHFDPRFCRGLEAEPYTQHELDILLGKR